MVTVLWTVYVYGLAFGDGGSMNSFIGSGKLFLSGAEVDTVSGAIPESVFQMFQLTVVYSPVAHWVWGGGFLGAMGVLDFAGGTVVHINAGIAALVLCVILVNGRATQGT